MGMSASQARLISLTARMSDVEYEAQQINQQRLTLSNKMNEVYEALCNMDVPTAPSKIDYMHKEYTGSTSTGQAIKVTTDKNGNFVVQRYANGETADYAGNVSNKTSATKYFTSAPEEDVKPKGREISHTYKYTDNAKSNEDIAANKEYRKAVLKKCFTEGDLKDINIDQYLNDKNNDGTTNYFELGGYGALYWDGGKLKDNDNDDYEVYDGSEFEVKYTDESAYTQDQIDEMVGKYYIDDGSGTAKLLSADDFDSEGHLIKGDLMVESPEGKNTGKKLTVEYSSDTFGGYTMLSLTEAKEKYGDDTELQNLLLGISHTFPGQEGDFTIMVDSSGNFRACFTCDLENGDSTVRTYQFNAQGKYWEEAEEADPDSITFDTNGNVNGVSVGNEKINLEVEMVTDEDKYEIAMDKYKSDKVEYDAEQNRLNKQTSIYQRQDKQLELKLERLDSERNALNTEIESVKKVIQDAIDKGFKTFSG